MTTNGDNSDRGSMPELTTRIWMDGNHEWFAYLEDEQVYLGGREVPYPLREGDSWSNRFGERFLVRGGEIRKES